MTTLPNAARESLERHGILADLQEQAGIVWDDDSKRIRISLGDEEFAWVGTDDGDTPEYSAVTLYPEAAIKRNDTLYLTFDPRHVLCLHELALNAGCVTTHDYADLPYHLPICHRIVALITGKEIDHAEEIRRLIAERTDHPFLVKIPGGVPIHVYLERFDTGEERLAAFHALCSEHLETEAQPGVVPIHAIGRIVQREGRLILDGTNTVLSPWVGKCVQYGTSLLRIAGKLEPQPYSTYELEHREGGRLKVTVTGRQRLHEALRMAEGFEPRWAVESSASEPLQNWLDQATDGARRVDWEPWQFGYSSSSLEFVTRSTLISKDGVRANQTKMAAPLTPLHDQFDLPNGSMWQTEPAVRLVWERFTRCHDHQLTLPLLATALMAPVRRVVAPQVARYVLYVSGVTGSGKTSRARLVQAMFGAFPDDQSILTWDATPKSIEAILATAGDAVVLVDDLKTSLRKEPEVREIMRVLMAQAQGVGRMRYSKNMTIDSDGDIQSTPIVTCERFVVNDPAVAARGIHIEAPVINLIDSAQSSAWEECVENHKLFAYFTSDWICWVLRNRHRWDKVWTSADKMVGLGLEQFTPRWRHIPNIPRLRDRCRVMTAFFLLGLYHAHEAGIDKDWLRELHGTWVKVLTTTIKLNAERMMDALPDTNLEAWLAEFAQAVGTGKKFINVTDHSNVVIGAWPYKKKAHPVGVIEVSPAPLKGVTLPCGDGQHASLAFLIHASSVGRLGWSSIKDLLTQTKCAHENHGKLRSGKARGMVATVDVFRNFLAIIGTDVATLVEEARANAG